MLLGTVLGHMAAESKFETGRDVNYFPNWIIDCSCPLSIAIIVMLETRLRKVTAVT